MPQGDDFVAALAEEPLLVTDRLDSLVLAQNSISCRGAARLASTMGKAGARHTSSGAAGRQAGPLPARPATPRRCSLSTALPRLVHVPP